jgi:flavin reductase (DIM6/NTAB) family NADH-FMN oxidoreductase RutF
MKRISQADILAMDKFYRTAFVNSLPGVRQANLIGTNSKSGITNVAVFNSVVHIGAHPPYMGFIMRPVSAERHTYNNIKETGYFTINQVNEAIFKQAHQTSARYEVSEFEATGLTPFFSEAIHAPYVAECNVRIGLKYKEEYPIICNNTILIIGEVMEVFIDENNLNNDGIVQLQQLSAVGVGGLETYYSLAKLEQLPYAKP